MPVTDSFGRSITSLRVSVTDRCNFSCSYCMPEEDIEWFPSEEILSYEELLRLVRLFAKTGISKVKVTGGEPTVRRDLDFFLGHLSKIEGVSDISLTTNAYLLDKLADRFRDAGLGRITVSLDSLHPDRFNRIVRRKIFDRVYGNILALRDYPFAPVKINTVIIKGFNDDEIPDFIEFARDTGFTVRFIEFMPLDGDRSWSKERIVPLNDLIGRVSAEYGMENVRNFGPESPSTEYLLSNGARVAFIPTVSNPFCSSCGRVRITATGHLRTCLFSHDETDLKSLLRGGKTDAELLQVIEDRLYHKEEGHLINKNSFRQPARTMHQIGG